MEVVNEVKQWEYSNGDGSAGRSGLIKCHLLDSFEILDSIVLLTRFVTF